MGIGHFRLPLSPNLGTTSRRTFKGIKPKRRFPQKTVRESLDLGAHPTWEKNRELDRWGKKKEEGSWRDSMEKEMGIGRKSSHKKT